MLANWSAFPAAFPAKFDALSNGEPDVFGFIKYGESDSSNVPLSEVWLGSAGPNVANFGFHRFGIAPLSDVVFNVSLLTLGSEIVLSLLVSSSVSVT